MNLRPKTLMFAMLGTALLAPGGSVTAQSAAKCTITVKVTGIHGTDGNVKVNLWSDPATVAQSRVAEIDAKTMTATAAFENMAPGTYSVSVIHDLNNNGKLDFNEMGMPVEGYGHSNNPAQRMGPPNFEETKFTVNQPARSVEIKLIYWQ